MIREYNGWRIEKVGGFCTIQRYIAQKGNKRHWAFRLGECKSFCDLRDADIEISKLYLTPLYA